MPTLRIDGPIINLAHWYGIDMKTAASFIAELARIDTSRDGVRKWQPSPANEIEIVQKNDPRYARAKRRINMMEKALRKLANGQPVTSDRKKWRRNPEDSAYVFDTFIHVISRPKPVTEEDIETDIRSLLVRTREAVDYRYAGTAPPTYEGKMGIGVEVVGNEIRVSNATNEGVQVRGMRLGYLNFIMQEDLPDSLVQKMKAQCEAAEPTKAIIEWKALYGAMESQLQGCGETQWYGSGSSPMPKTQIYTDTGYVGIEKETGRIFVRRPGEEYCEDL